MSEQRHQVTVFAAGGEVLVSLPDDEFIKCTPEQARTLASHLLVSAADALGEERPHMVLLKTS